MCRYLNIRLQHRPFCTALRFEVKVFCANTWEKKSLFQLSSQRTFTLDRTVTSNEPTSLFFTSPCSTGIESLYFRSLIFSSNPNPGVPSYLPLSYPTRLFVGVTTKQCALRMYLSKSRWSSSLPLSLTHTHFSIFNACSEYIFCSCNSVPIDVVRCK